MMRPLSLLATLLVAASVVGYCHAQTAKMQPGSAGPKEAPSSTITLYAMPQTDPLFRYRLWPAPESRRQINPTPLITRALLLENQVPPDVRKEFNRKQGDWAELPLDRLPREEIRRLLSGYESVFRELRRAENLMQLDYDIQLDQLSGPELLGTLLPEFQGMRELARLLALRARVAVAEQRWDDFVADCRSGFRLAEIAGHSTDFLLGRIVGFAMSNMMMSVIEEAIQRPGCPNLYWALVALPDQRLFETRESLEFESVLLARVFDAAEPLPDRPIGEDAARERIRKLVTEARLVLSNLAEDDDDRESSSLMAGLFVAMMTEPSRELLDETGVWRNRADQLSPSEAVLRASRLTFSRKRDHWVGWSMLPPHLWDEYASERNEAFAGQQPRADLLAALIRGLMPAVDASHQAGRRSFQKRNLLCTLEAIRMHAAEKGEFPASIKTLRPVPAWQDAITLESFGYQRTAPDRAVVSRASRWSGDTDTKLVIELKGMP